MLSVSRISQLIRLILFFILPAFTCVSIPPHHQQKIPTEKH